MSERKPEAMVRAGVQAALAAVHDTKIPETLAIEATAIALVTRAFVATKSVDKAEEVATRAIADAIIPCARGFAHEPASAAPA